MRRGNRRQQGRQDYTSGADRSGNSSSGTGPPIQIVESEEQEKPASESSCHVDSKELATGSQDVKKREHNARLRANLSGIGGTSVQTSAFAFGKLYVFDPICLCCLVNLLLVLPGEHGCSYAFDNSSRTGASLLATRTASTTTAGAPNKHQGKYNCFTEQGASLEREYITPAPWISSMLDSTGRRNAR